MIDFCHVLSKILPYKPPSVKGYSLKNPYPQRFPYPTYMMKYITMNPTTPKLWKKLIKTCKYFYSRNPVIVCADFNGGTTGDKLSFSVKKKFYNIKVDEFYNIKADQMNYKLWVTGRTCTENINFNIWATKVYRNNIKRLVLVSFMITFDDLKIIGVNGTLEIIAFLGVTVEDKDRRVVTLEEIAEAFSSILHFIHRCYSETVTITQKTAQKIIEIYQSSPLITKVILDNLPEQFEFQVIFDYIMQKQPLISFELSFADNISSEYKERLDFGIKEIIASKNTIFPVQHITYDFWDKYSLLYPLYSTLYQDFIYARKCIKYRRSINCKSNFFKDVHCIFGLFFVFRSEIL